jgi:hypothetical protein
MPEKKILSQARSTQNPSLHFDKSFQTPAIPTKEMKRRPGKILALREWGSNAPVKDNKNHPANTTAEYACKKPKCVSRAMSEMISSAGDRIVNCK